MSGGGGGGSLGVGGSSLGLGAAGIGLAATAYNRATGGRGKLGQIAQQYDMIDAINPPDAPNPGAAPTMEDTAAKEPDKEARRRQRMAALMAQGRQGTILTGPGGMTPNNSVGGGGKQMVGA